MAAWTSLGYLHVSERFDRNRHGGGCPRKYELHRVVETLLYVVTTGCQSRHLPVNFPPWLSVHQQLRAWRNDGTWGRVTRFLREQSRKVNGRNAAPTMAIVDPQSAKTVLEGGSAATTLASSAKYVGS